MGSDWDYINEHMGGHDEDGLPNFMSEPGYGWDDYEDPYVWSRFDKTSYQDVLELAHLGENYSDLVIENHVFTTYKEAVNAARELAIRTHSAVKTFINHEKKIYSIYDPEMDAAIYSLKCCEIEIGPSYYPKSLLIRLREKDIIHHELRSNWLFVAHPNGKTENLERNILACIQQVFRHRSYNVFSHRSYNPFNDIENNSDLIRSKRPDVLNRSLEANTISERDDILNRALIIAKAKKINVYVVGHRTHYVMFTENKINEIIGKYIESIDKRKVEEQQRLKERLKKQKEIDD